MSLIIAIDDTDNLESRGTGHVARKLASHLCSKGLLEPHLIIRHQLYVSPEIPFTSHNSSASIRGKLTGNVNDIKNELVSFVFANSAPGSDAGVCFLETEAGKDYSKIIEWGKRAKTQVLKKEEAYTIAESENVFLKGLTGEKIGVIGSLAAVGLHLYGNDGRVLWLEGLRETRGIFKADQFRQKFGLDKILNIDNSEIPPDSLINVTEWTRPVMKNNLLTLFVEYVNSDDYEYQSAPKQFIKNISE